MSKFLTFECNLDTFINELEKKLENNTKTIENLLKQEKKRRNFYTPSLLAYCVNIKYYTLHTSCCGHPN